MPIVTPDICDDHPEVQVVDPGFRNYGGVTAFGGPIVTVKCFEDNSLVKELVATPGQGRVMVVDGGGSYRCALLGDMLAEKAAASGWAGLIIYGCVRDVDVLGQTSLGVQALGSHPRKSNKRGVGEQDIPVTFSGVTFQPGHYVYADNNGIVVSEKPLFGE